MEDWIPAVELVLEGWMFGIMTCLLCASVRDYAAIKRRNLRHQKMLAAGYSPLDILMDDSA
jgi:hypothetical protein